MSQKITLQVPSVEKHCPEFLNLQQRCCENLKSHTHTHTYNLSQAYNYCYKCHSHVTNKYLTCVISGFCHEVAENCALLGYYAAGTGNLLPIFHNNLSVPSSGFKNPKEILQPQYRVHIGKSVGSENVSVVWCQPIGL
jgi:hypothetical protein